MQLLVSGSSVSRLLTYQTVYNHPRDAFLLHYIEYAVVSHPVISLLDALQSSKRCVSPVLSMELSLSVYRLSADRVVYSHLRNCFSSAKYAIVGTVYNHPKDASLLH